MAKYECTIEHAGRFGELRPGMMIDASDPKLPACYQRALDEAPHIFKKLPAERAVRRPKNEAETR